MKQLFKHPLVAGLALIALIAASGCGSSDGEEADANGPALAKPLYIQKGDRICQDNYAKRGRLLTRLSQEFSEGKNLPPPARQEAILVNQVMPIFWEESKELNALPLPEEGTKEAEEILAALEVSIESVEADPARSIREGSGVEFKEVERLAHEYGFEWCGRS